MRKMSVECKYEVKVWLLTGIIFFALKGAFAAADAIMRELLENGET
jgi:hypothetical protein